MSLHHTILRIRQYLQKKIVLHINFKRVPWYLFQAIHYLKWSDHFRMFYSAGKVSAGPTRIFSHRELQTCIHWLSCSFQPWHTVPKMKRVFSFFWLVFFLRCGARLPGLITKFEKGRPFGFFLIIKFCSYSYKYFLLGNDFDHN